ncbi:hypothetical protein CWO89_20065 [Bradyrhizobium sp. Leo170]|nr:hypothetical protein CWO89_20065 [Bradyrhizobium sp. Leo170]
MLCGLAAAAGHHHSCCRGNCVHDERRNNFGAGLEKLRTNATSPFGDAIDITVQFQNMWNSYRCFNTPVHIGHQTAGNGANGCLIYGSWVEIGFV